MFVVSYYLDEPLSWVWKSTQVCNLNLYSLQVAASSPHPHYLADGSLLLLVFCSTDKAGISLHLLSVTSQDGPDTHKIIGTSREKKEIYIDIMTDT